MKMRFLMAFAVFILISGFSLAQPECDYKVDIIANGEEFDKGKFRWRMKAVKLEGSPTNITGRATIESAGRLVKEYNPWNSEPISKQKTSIEYSPNLKEDEYKITAEIKTECDDANRENNIDVKLITIKSGSAEHIEIPVVNNNTIQKLNIEIEANNAACPIQENASKDSKPIPTSNVAKETVYEPVYESSNQKAKNLIAYLLLGTSILLNVVLIWKR